MVTGRMDDLASLRLSFAGVAAWFSMGFFTGDCRIPGGCTLEG